MTYSFFLTDAPYKSIISDVLVLAEYYSTIMRFIEERYQFNNGRVNQALCGVLEDLMQDYRVSIFENHFFLDFIFHSTFIYTPFTFVGVNDSVRNETPKRVIEPSRFAVQYSSASRNHELFVSRGSCCSKGKL